MPNYGSLAKNIGKFVSENSPIILTSMAVAGVLSTTVLAVRGTPEALRRMEEAVDAKDGDSLKPFEIVKATWLCYVPAASVGIVTITCIIAGNAISTKRNAALMSLYTLTESGFREYQDKVTETFGKDKEEKVRAEVLRDQVRREGDLSREVVIVEGENKVLMRDSISGRYFKNDIESVRRAENDINEIIVQGQNYASLNDFYAAIGLPPTETGNQLGWTTDQLLHVKFSATVDEESGTKPCFAIEYRHFPVKGYYATFLD